MALACGERFDGENQNAANELGLSHVVKVIPVHGLAVSHTHLCQNCIGESRRTCAAYHLVKVKHNVRDWHILPFCNIVEPPQNVVDKPQHDWKPRFAHECPLAERLRLLAEDGMVVEVRLVDLNADDHIYISLIVSIWDESINGLERFDVNVGIDSSFHVHN